MLEAATVVAVAAASAVVAYFSCVLLCFAMLYGTSYQVPVYFYGLPDMNSSVMLVLAQFSCTVFCMYFLY